VGHHQGDAGPALMDPLRMASGADLSPGCLLFWSGRLLQIEHLNKFHPCSTLISTTESRSRLANCRTKSSRRLLSAGMFCIVLQRCGSFPCFDLRHSPPAIGFACDRRVRNDPTVQPIMAGQCQSSVELFAMNLDMANCLSSQSS
jgi:hypothetical protein